MTSLSQTSAHFPRPQLKRTKYFGQPNFASPSANKLLLWPDQIVLAYLLDLVQIFRVAFAEAVTVPKISMQRPLAILVPAPGTMMCASSEG